MSDKNPRITPEEIGIIKRAQAGDISAFNTLFYKYKGFVTAVINHYIHDYDEAQYLANEVFLKVYEKLSMFKAYDSFGGWLRIISNRTAIDYLREMKNKRNLLGDDDAYIFSPDATTEDDLVNRMRYDEVVAEFNKLSETNRKVHQLFYVYSMTVEQISEKLNVPTGTIKSMLSRTRRKLQEKFKTL